MKKVLFAVAIFLATLSTGVSGSAGATSVSMIKTPETNQASYWGGTCTKTEMSGEVLTYTATGDDVTKVIVKGGPAYVVYSSGRLTDLTAPINPKNNKPYAVSHVIECSTVTTPTDPVDPVDPVDPTDPTDPTVPTTPTTPEPPKQPVVIAETDDTTKGGTPPTITTPTELPNTGAGDMMPALTAGIGMIIVAYSLKLAAIKSRLSD